MKRSMKRLLTLSLTGAILLSETITSYAEQWKYEETVETDYDGSTYTNVHYYLVDDVGQRILNREWEGGALLADGELYIDEVYIENDKLKYYGRGTEPIEGTLEWKYQLLKQWKDLLTANEKVGTINMDFQLPAEWSEQCPSPLMTAAIDFTCLQYWGGYGFVNWTDSWSVDENNVIHITATYY